MTIWCGGMLRSITMAAPAIAGVVTAIVIAGQRFLRKSPADMLHSAPYASLGDVRFPPKAERVVGDPAAAPYPSVGKRTGPSITLSAICGQCPFVSPDRFDYARAALHLECISCLIPRPLSLFGLANLLFMVG